MVLRGEGVFSLMILNNDLRVITANPVAELNVIQKQIIKDIGQCMSSFLAGFKRSNSNYKSREILRPVCLFGGVRGLGKP